MWHNPWRALFAARKLNENASAAVRERWGCASFECQCVSLRSTMGNVTWSIIIILYAHYGAKARAGLIANYRIAKKKRNFNLFLMQFYTVSLCVYIRNVCACVQTPPGSATTIYTLWKYYINFSNPRQQELINFSGYTMLGQPKLHWKKLISNVGRERVLRLANARARYTGERIFVSLSMYVLYW